jgi:hypothetical protein
MKRLFIMTIISATLLAARFLYAEPVHLSLIDSVANSGPALMRCTVNGITYPVDSSYNVWGVNVYGWYIIGHLYSTRDGYAIVNGGVAYGASCF